MPGAVRRGAAQARQWKLERAAEEVDIEDAQSKAMVWLGESALDLSTADLVELRGGPVIYPDSQKEQAKFHNFAAGRALDSHEGMRQVIYEQK